MVFCLSVSFKEVPASSILMVDHFPSFFIAGAWGYHSLIQKRSPILKPTVEAIVWRFAMWPRVFFTTGTSCQSDGIPCLSSLMLVLRQRICRNIYFKERKAEAHPWPCHPPDSVNIQNVHMYRLWADIHRCYLYHGEEQKSACTMNLAQVPRGIRGAGFQIFQGLWL